MNQKDNNMKYMAFCGGKNEDCATCLKNSVRILAESIHEMQSLGGSSICIIYKNG
jgi:hypothetical protein